MDQSSEIPPVAPNWKGYLLVGLTQCACIAIMVALSYANFHSAQTKIAAVMLAAFFNGVIIAGISMHLRSERWTIYRVLIFTFIFLLVMFFLPLLAFHDRIYIH